MLIPMGACIHIQYICILIDCVGQEKGLRTFQGDPCSSVDTGRPRRAVHFGSRQEP